MESENENVFGAALRKNEKKGGGSAMRKNVLVVDDHPKYREMLRSILATIDEELNVLEAEHIGDAYRYAMEMTIHLFILDIILDPSVRGDLSGLEFAAKMREQDKYRTTPIVFITSLEDPKLYTYSELHCYQYMEKPINADEAARILREALGIVAEEKRDRYMFFRKDGLVFPVKIEDILYITFEKHLSKIVLGDDWLEIPYISLRKMLLKLDSPDFEQCNRYTIVNRNHIEYVNLKGNLIKIKNKDILLPIGAIYKKKIMSGSEDDR